MCIRVSASTGPVISQIAERIEVERDDSRERLPTINSYLQALEQLYHTTGTTNDKYPVIYF